MTEHDLLDQVLKLPRESRVAFAAEILASLEPSSDSQTDVEHAWGEVATRRLREILAGVTTTIPAEQVHAEARARLAARRSH